MKVAVGLSGGVDSSVAALRMVEAGHEVMGITMKIWSGESSSSSVRHACYSPNEDQEIEIAQKVCDILEIPFYLYDCSADYQAIVLDNFRDQYILGNTPNPCVICNQKVKFGVLLQLAKKEINFDSFATGHYARTHFDQEGKRFQLLKAKDPMKDQTYFLYRLNQEQLSSTIFPLGELTKDEVYHIARKAGLPTSEEKESQDFYDGDYRELIKMPPKQGNIVTQEGEVVGQHEGYWNFTIGQRRGLRVSSSQPLYVLKLVPEKNEVVVGSKKEGERSCFWVSDINWVSWEGLRAHEEVQVKTRSTQVPRPATLSMDDEKNKIKVSYDLPENAVTPGQSAVFYDDDIVIGGGIISSR